MWKQIQLIKSECLWKLIKGFILSIVNALIVPSVYQEIKLWLSVLNVSAIIASLKLVSLLYSLPWITSRSFRVPLAHLVAIKLPLKIYASAVISH